LHFIDSEIVTLSILFFIFKKKKNIFITVPAPYEIQNVFYKYTYNPIRKILVKWLFKYVKPIAHTEYVKKSLIDSKIVSNFKIPVIPWGIDRIINDYSKSETKKLLCIGEDKKVFGFFGYLLAQKGFYFAIENWTGLDRNFILLARVHSDYAEDKNWIQNFIDEKKLNDKIIFNFGYTSEEDLALNISVCDAILLPYQKKFYGESGIMSLACSHKIPLVAANVGKIGRTVKEKGLGLVFDAESALSFKNAIEKFANLSEKDIEKIKENIDVYASSLGWKEIAKKHMEFYGRK
jgi:glycosyltransferase involved in cell wall biosynthesis